MSISVQEAPFDAGLEGAALAVSGAGAVVTFTGLVREFSADQHLSAMELEHYPGMTEKALLRIVEDAEARWPLLAVRIVHRVGRLLPGDPIVFVGVAAAHRGEAFAAAEYLMDFLKTRAPFWKREWHGDVALWVEQKERDLQAEQRWQVPRPSDTPRD